MSPSDLLGKGRMDSDLGGQLGRMYNGSQVLRVYIHSHSDTERGQIVKEIQYSPHKVWYVENFKK